MKTLIIYAIIATIYEAVYFYSGWIKFKAIMLKDAGVRAFIEAIMSHAFFKDIKSKVWNWYTIAFVLTPLFIIVSQFIFPVTVFHQLRRLIFGKSKLEKQVEAEKKMAEEAAKKHEEWMKTEGDMMPHDDEPLKIIKE